MGTALPQWLMRIGEWFAKKPKIKWVCRIGAASIGAVVFAGKLITKDAPRKKARQVLSQTAEVAKGYAMKFRESAKEVARKVKGTVAAIGHKVATGIRSAARKTGDSIRSIWKKIAAWF